MVQACSMKLSRDLGTHHSLGCNVYHTSMMGKGRLNFAHINLSSHALRQDAWSLDLNGLRRPMTAVSSRYNVFVCRSVLIPGGGNHIPLLKSTDVILSRFIATFLIAARHLLSFLWVSGVAGSYDALCGIPHVLQLIPAVGAIAFALWGLGPIMRFCRIIVLRKSDSTWNKSITRYLMTSYLRPLLLWIGATLVCRALDPVILHTKASQAVKQHVLYFVRSLSTVLASAYCLSRLIRQVQKRNDNSDAANMGFSFAWKAIYYGVWVAAVSFSMELLGFSTQKWMTAGGLGTVLITLAGREIFENFLSSVMLHATRPFVANEWIQTNIGGYEVSGVIERVGWWSPTVVRGDDREAVHIPNHKFNSSVVRNLSQKTHWRIKTHLAISHLDYNKINIIVADMRKVIAKNPQVEQRMLHKRVFFENIDPVNQSLMILVSCFVKTSHIEEYFCVKEAILLDLLRVISHHRARLATPIRTVQKVYGEADMEGIPFAETIFSPSRSAAKRPLLLIEPDYKVNGDTKSKISKDETASNSDSKVGGSTLTIDPILNDMVTASSVDALKETIVLNSEPSGKVSKKPEVQTQSNQDVEKNVASTAITRPPLEENIVLGAALEGSKRTLPINDGDEVSPPSIVRAKDSKEFSSRRNGSAVGKDKKDGPMSAVPSGFD